MHKRKYDIMKALFIACDQALYDEVQQNMKALGVRGYTSWEEVTGCGTATGEPHLGDAVWPMMNSAIISITDDERCWKLLDALRVLDAANPKLGLRAFWWEVGGTL
jgi:hypothetical protein